MTWFMLPISLFLIVIPLVVHRHGDQHCFPEMLIFLFIDAFSTAFCSGDRPQIPNGLRRIFIFFFRK